MVVCFGVPLQIAYIAHEDTLQRHELIHNTLALRYTSVFVRVEWVISEYSLCLTKPPRVTSFEFTELGGYAFRCVSKATLVSDDAIPSRLPKRSVTDLGAKSRRSTGAISKLFKRKDAIL